MAAEAVNKEKKEGTFNVGGEQTQKSNISVSSDMVKNIQQTVEMKLETLLRQTANVTQKNERMKLIAPCGRPADISNENFISMFASDIASRWTVLCFKPQTKKKTVCCKPKPSPKIYLNPKTSQHSRRTKATQMIPNRKISWVKSLP